MSNNTISQDHGELMRPLTRGFKRLHPELDFENAEFRKGRNIAGLEQERPRKRTRRTATAAVPTAPTAAVPAPAAPAAVPVATTPADNRPQSLASRAANWVSTPDYREMYKLRHKIRCLNNVLQRSAVKRGKLEAKISEQIGLFDEYQDRNSPWTAASSRDLKSEDLLFELWNFSTMRISQWQSWIKLLASKEVDVNRDIAAKRARVVVLVKRAPITIEEEQSIRADPALRSILSGSGIQLNNPPCSINTALLGNDEHQPPGSLHRELSHEDNDEARASYKSLVRFNARLMRLRGGDWRHGEPIATVNDLEQGPEDIEDLLYELWRNHAEDQVSYFGTPVEKVLTFLEQCHAMIVEMLEYEIRKVRFNAWEKFGMYTTSRCKVALVSDSSANLEPLETSSMPDHTPKVFAPEPARKMQCIPFEFFFWRDYSPTQQEVIQVIPLRLPLLRDQARQR